MTKKNEVSIAGVNPGTISELELVVKDFALANQDDSDTFKTAFKLAEGMKILDDMLTPEVMEPIIRLKNKGLGFKTDENDGSNGRKKVHYDMATVKSCFIESVLMGLRPTNNEWNIIAGNLYVAKNGLARKVKEFPGLTDLEIKTTIVKSNDTSAEVEFKAKWFIDGVEQRMSGVIPIRRNAYMGLDAILGKADRKALARIYQRLTGSAFTIPEGDVGEIEDVEVTVKTNEQPALKEGRQGVYEKEKEPVKTSDEWAEEAAKEKPETNAAEQDVMF